MKFWVNLSGDFPLPFQVFADINQQLTSEKQLPANLFIKPLCELETTNDWINLEALGKPAALRAKALALQLCQRMDYEARTIHLNILLGDQGLTSDNLYALIYLNEQIEHLHIVFYFANEIADTQKNKIKHITELKAEWLDKALAGEQSNAQWQQLREATIKQLKANNLPLNDNFFSQTQLTDQHTGLLIAYGWTCLKAGAHDIACHAIETCLHTFELSTGQSELLFMHLQLIRFLSHQYLLVSECVFPARFMTLSEKECNGLYFIKAYAATMSRQIETAEKYFAKCHVDEQMELKDEDCLYRLNLYALSRVIRGKDSLAYQLEKRIESFAEEHKINILGLNYVNRINIARLHKKAGQYDLSRTYYHKAYQQISQGGFTYSDFIYYHLNFGGIEEAAGNHRLALQHYIYTAAYWLAYDNPLALAWRPRLILCQEKLTDILTPLSISAANRFLIDKIQKLVEHNQCNLQIKTTDVQFLGSNQAMMRHSSCHIDEQAVFYVLQEKEQTGQPKQADHTSRELADLVFAYLQSEKKVHTSAKTIIMETRMDKEIPADMADALKLAAINDCAECFYLKDYFNADTIHANSESNMFKWQLAGTIEGMQPTEQGLKLSYQRSFLNKLIQSPDEIKQIQQLSDLKSHVIEDKELILNLLNKRVIATPSQIEKA